jgi:hypothetical protein
MEHSSEKLPQFSQGKNSPHTLASNIDVFLPRGSPVFQSSKISLFGTKYMILPLKSGRCIQYSFQKLTQFSKVNNAKVTPASTQMMFFQEKHVFS